MISRIGALLGLYLLAGCAFTPAGELQTGTAPTSTTSAAQTRITPLVDHHQHLLSPASAALSSTPIVPAVDVPKDIAAMLRDRAERSADPERLAAVFTPDALMLGFGQASWIRGADQVAIFISQNFRPGHELTPIAYEETGRVGKVFGYYTRGDGEARSYPGYFQLTLARGPNGSWRIASEVPVFPGPSILPVIDSQALIEMLDAAEIKRAVILSNAYYFDGALKHPGDPATSVRAENDWTAEQVARFPDRLVGFCSLNPLAAHAIAELERCSRKPEMRGLKLHLDTSGLELTNPGHATRLREVFAAANRLGTPILIHLSANTGYDRSHAEIFIKQVLPAAPDIPVVIAHLWGGGDYSDDALAVYANAVETGNPATGNLYFELAQVTLVEGHSEENLRRIASRMRQIGLGRIFYGSDGAVGFGRPPREVWRDFHIRMPLTDEEFRRIAGNIAPFMQ